MAEVADNTPLFLAALDIINKRVVWTDRSLRALMSAIRDRAVFQDASVTGFGQKPDGFIQAGVRFVGWRGHDFITEVVAGGKREVTIDCSRRNQFRYSFAGPVIDYDSDSSDISSYCSDDSFGRVPYNDRFWRQYMFGHDTLGFKSLCMTNFIDAIEFPDKPLVRGLTDLRLELRPVSIDINRRRFDVNFKFLRNLETLSLQSPGDFRTRLPVYDFYTCIFGALFNERMPLTEVSPSLQRLSMKGFRSQMMAGIQYTILFPQLVNLIHLELDHVQMHFNTGNEYYNVDDCAFSVVDFSHMQKLEHFSICNLSLDWNREDVFRNRFSESLEIKKIVLPKSVQHVEWDGSYYRKQVTQPDKWEIVSGHSVNEQHQSTSNIQIVSEHPSTSNISQSTPSSRTRGVNEQHQQATQPEIVNQRPRRARATAKVKRKKHSGEVLYRRPTRSRTSREGSIFLIIKLTQNVRYSFTILF